MYVFTDPVSKTAINEKLTHYQIFKYYVPELEYGRVIKSPLRKERNPSFGILMGKRGNTVYNDLASPDSGDVFSFVGKLFNLGFNEVLNKINIDFNLGLTSTLSREVSLPATAGILVDTVSAPSKHNITVHPRPWSSIDTSYWGKIGLSLGEVFLSNTYPISAFRMDQSTTIAADKLAYCMDFYDDGDGIMLRKIYQPYNKERKWRTNLTPLVVDGIKELPDKGELLIITKSRKDRLVLKHYGYNAISTNSESSFIPDKVFEKLKLRFTTILIFFDSDKAGKINSDKLSVRHGISKTEIPDAWNVTDISEFREGYGDHNTRQLLKILFKRI